MVSKKYTLILVLLLQLLFAGVLLSHFSSKRQVNKSYLLKFICFVGFRVRQFWALRSKFLPNVGEWSHIVVCVLIAFTGHTIVRLVLGKVPGWIISLYPWKVLLLAYLIVYTFEKDSSVYKQFKKPWCQLLLGWLTALHKYFDQVKLVAAASTIVPWYVVIVLCSVDIFAGGAVLGLYTDKNSFAMKEWQLKDIFWFILPGCISTIGFYGSISNPYFTNMEVIPLTYMLHRCTTQHYLKVMPKMIKSKRK